MKRLHGLAIFLFLVAETVFAWPWLSGTVVIPYDAKAHFWPQLAFLSQSLHAGDSPFWAPNVFAGTPQVADPQSLIFTPPYFLLALLEASPTFREADAVAFAMLTFAGIAAILFFRDRDWHPAGGFLAALVVACGASAAWRLQHVGEVISYAWFIVALWLVARALRRASIAWGVAAGIVAGFMIVGRDQIAFLAAIVIGAFTLHELFATGWRGRIAPLLAAAIAGFAVTVVPVAFTIALAQQSNRASIAYATAIDGALQPTDFLTAIVADLYSTASYGYWGDFNRDPTNYVLARNMADIYMGAAPILLLLIGLVAGRRMLARESWFFIAAIIVAILYALGDHTPFFKLAFAVPGVDLFRRPADATFILGGLTGILAGYVLHRWIMFGKALRGAATWVVLSLVVMLFALCVYVALDHERLTQARPALVAAGVLFILAGTMLLLARRLGHRQPFFVMLMVAALTTGDIVWSNGRNDSTGLPPEQFDFLRVATKDPLVALLKSRRDPGDGDRSRVELAGLGFYWPNAGLVHGFDHDLGYNPVRLATYANTMKAGDQIADPKQRIFGGLFASYRSPLADLVGLRTIVTPRPIETIDPAATTRDFPLVATLPDAFVYDNPRAMPRVFFAGAARQANFGAMLASGDWGDVDLSKTVLLETTSPSSAARSGTARLIRYRNAQVDIDVESEGGYVVLNDAWQRWWRVDIDDAPAEMLRANVVFRAVAVPPGRHRVVFSFHPFVGLWNDIAAMINGGKTAAR